MESVCDLDNNQLPSLRGLADRFNKALPIMWKSRKPGMKPELGTEATKEVFK